MRLASSFSLRRQNGKRSPEIGRHRGTKYVLVGLLIFALVGVFFIGRSSVTPARLVPTAKVPITFSAFYLDVGASASLGFQPTGIKGHNGRSTDDGYADDLALMERYVGTSLDVYKTGCPGETLQSYLSTDPEHHCNNAPTTQLSNDLAYLRARKGGTGLITIDIGFNNMRVCLSPLLVNENCVNKTVAAAELDIPKIVNVLKAASGSNVRIVGLEYNDPFLGRYLDGPAGPSDANATLVAMNRFNSVLKSAYSSAGASVADVPAFFRMKDTDLVSLTGKGSWPENVKEACALTWICYSSPFGPDDHPNDAGYSLIAKAIFATLPKMW